MCRYIVLRCVVLLVQTTAFVVLSANTEARPPAAVETAKTAGVSCAAVAECQDKAEDKTIDDKALAEEQDKTIALLNKDLQDSLSRQLDSIPKIHPEDPNAVDAYSRRGDLLMFLGRFDAAEADYKQMVTLNPDLDSSHWRLGIAMYFAGHPEQAAEQFDKYHSFDNVDRENGIWRYLSHRAAFGKEMARKQLLKYEKDDRPPFREVYRLFDGSLSPAEVLSAIPANLEESPRDSRLFYSHLYIGLNSAAEGQSDKAIHSLRLATLNNWPRKAGYGPNYMWHIGRLKYLELHHSQQPEKAP